MSEAQDIRAWAAGRGIDIGERGRVPTAVREQYRAEHADPPFDDTQADDVTTATEPPPPEPPASPAVEGRVAERPPRPPRTRGGLLGRRQRKPRDRKPAPRRVSIENIVSSGWSLAAMAMARSPRSIPVARILDMQAPVAGIIVDEAARGTVVDKILQPFARAGEKAEKAMALVGPPVLVAAMTANPQLYPVLRPALKMTMMSWMQVSGPAMRKAEARVAKFAEEFGDVDLDGMIDALWADLPIATQASEAEEDAIRRARGE